MPAISRIWARSALISAGLQPQQENWNPATGQRNWPTHPAVPPGTDDQNSTPTRELEPPQPLLRSLDGGQHPCAKIGVSTSAASPRRRSCRRQRGSTPPLPGAAPGSCVTRRAAGGSSRHTGHQPELALVMMDEQGEPTTLA